MGIKELKEDFQKEDKKISSRFYTKDPNGVKKPDWGKIIVAWVLTLLVASLVISAISFTTQEQETNLNLRHANSILGVNETDYTIVGSTDVNSTVILSSSELDLNNKIIPVDSNGEFSYKITIPQNITDLDIKISSKAPLKIETFSNIHLERPTTSLSLDHVNFTDNDTSLTVSGNTDPNAEVNISSTDLNISNITISADNSGKFSYRLTIPDDENSFEINVKTQVTGKKIARDTLFVVRTLTPEPVVDVESTINSDNSSSSLSTSDSDSADSTQVIITRYGEKYHMYKHGNMKYTSTIPLSQAKLSYEPCKVCC